MVNLSKQDQRAVIQFLWVEVCQPTQIHRQILLSMVQHVYQRHLWQIRSVYFEQGRQQTTDILWPGKAHSVTNLDNVQVQNVVHEERCHSFISHQREMNISISRPSNCMGSWVSRSLFPVSAHCLTFAVVPYWGLRACVEDCGEQCDVVSPFEHRKISKHVHRDIPFHPNHRNSSHNNLLVMCCYVLWHWAISVFGSTQQRNNAVDAHHYCHTL